MITWSNLIPLESPGTANDGMGILGFAAWTPGPMCTCCRDVGIQSHVFLRSISQLQLASMPDAKGHMHGTKDRKSRVQRQAKRAARMKS